MRFYFDETNCICIEHNGVVIDWMSPDFDGGKSGSRNGVGDALFYELNGYAETLTEQEQETVFGLYKKIREIFVRVTIAGLCNALQPVVGKLFRAFIDIDAVESVMPMLKLEIPSTIDDGVVDTVNDRRTPDMTYNRDDYRDLQALIICFRAALPIWSMFWKYSGDTSYDKIYQFTDSIRILKMTDLISSRPYERLERYIAAAYGARNNAAQNKERELAFSVVGAGSTEVRQYLLASNICKCLVLKPLGNDDDGKPINLIPALYQRFENDLRACTSQLPQRIRKRQEGYGNTSDEPDKTGYLESWSMRQTVSDFIPILNEVSLHDYRTARKFIEPELPSADVKVFIDAHRQCKGRIDAKDITLVQWVMSFGYHPRAIPDVDREALINAMAIAQATLVFWGFRDVAVLLSTEAKELDEDDIYFVTPLLKITDEHLRKRLCELYPTMKSHHASTTGTRRGAKDHNSVAFRAIDGYGSLIAESKWYINTTSEVQKILGVKNGDYEPPKNLKTRLGELFLEINRQNTAREKSKLIGM